MAGALERGARLEAVYLADGAAPGFPTLLERARDASVPIVQLKDGVLRDVNDHMLRNVLGDKDKERDAEGARE